MKKNSDFFGLLLNVLLATIVIVFIVFGLNKIGLYELPSFIRKIIPSVQVEEDGDDEDEKIYDFGGFDEENKGEVEKTELDYENARKMLESMKGTRDYSHRLSVTVYSESGSLTKRINVERKNGLYSAEISSSEGMSLKSISEHDEKITVREYAENGSFTELDYPKGGFTVSELCGVVLTPDTFLEGDYSLAEGDFSLLEGDFGIELEIAFVSSLDGYELKEVYRINPDYGIVTRAESYEGDSLVYLMQTELLR